jgi:hypothetical protein
MPEALNFLYPIIEDNDYEQMLNALTLHYSSLNPSDDVNRVFSDISELLVEILSKETVPLKPIHAINQFLHSWVDDKIEKEYIHALFSLNLIEQGKLDLVMPFLAGSLSTPDLFMAAVIESEDKEKLDYLSNLPGFFVLKKSQKNLNLMVYAQSDLDFIHAYEKTFPISKTLAQHVQQDYTDLETLYLNCLKIKSVEHIAYLKEVNHIDLLAHEKSLLLIGSGLDADFRAFDFDKQFEFLNYYHQNFKKTYHDDPMHYLLDVYLSRIVNHTRDYQLFTNLLNASEKYQWTNNKKLINGLEYDRYVSQNLSGFLEHYNIHCEQKKLNHLIEEASLNKNIKPKMKV